MTPINMPERVNVTLTVTYDTAGILDEIVEKITARTGKAHENVTLDDVVNVITDYARIEMRDAALAYRFTAVTDEEGNEL